MSETAATNRRFLMRDLTGPARSGLLCILLVLLGGIAASAMHVWDHYRNRDERPAFTMTDLEGAYHGVTAESSLLAALRRGHPETAPAAAREALIAWLTGDKISENYDNLDLGDNAPSEIIAANCLSCHARAAAQQHEIARRVPLDYWDDVRPLAFSTRIEPTSAKVLVASTHAHALSLATLAVALSAMLLATGVSRAVLGLLIGAIGVGLLVDLSCWWIARSWSPAVWGVVAGGALFNGACVLASLVCAWELLLARRK